MIESGLFQFYANLNMTNKCWFRPGAIWGCTHFILRIACWSLQTLNVTLPVDLKTWYPEKNGTNLFLAV